MDSNDKPAAVHDSARDPWFALSALTPARVALGRSGGSLRTPALLDFRLAHARARDAVLAPFAAEPLCGELEAAGFDVERLSTAAVDRRTYLLRPDLGRRLSPESHQFLERSAPRWGKRDLVVIVSDGLSATAAHGQAAATLMALRTRLGEAGWTLFPVFVVPFARVKLQDEVGELLGACMSIILLGERPGLGAPDSLGAYFTYGPRSSCTDADRNCVSNIRPAGLPPERAAELLAGLMEASRRLGLSGVALKDEGDSLRAGIPPTG